MCRSLLKMVGNELLKPITPSINRLCLIFTFALFVQGVNAQFTVDFSITQPTCWGQPNGSVTAVVTGGTAPFSYLWNTGDTGPTLSNITAGTYTVTVTDATSFTVIKNATVTQPDVVNVDLIANTCEIPIVITATGSGGDPPYNYNWSTGDNTAVISVSTPGTYCVTMTDQNLCGAVECINVTLNPLNVFVSTNDLTCTDLNDGQVVANPVGGTPPYTYLWSNGATTASQTGLAAGVYTVTVTDAAGCMDTASGVVQSPPPLSVIASGVDPDCVGENDGQAIAVANGGTPPYTYLWSTGVTGPILTNIGQGTYTVTVTDVNGCTATDQVSINPISNLSVLATPTGESCPNENDGSVTATPLNGVPPYTYSWSNGANTQTINNLDPGVYSVTVVDAAGCNDVATAIVTSASPFVITVTGNNVTICDGNNGSATVNIIQGDGPFTFLWSNGQTSQTAVNLTGGTYMVTATDGSGCTQTGSIFITTPPDVSVSIIADDVVCPGEATGSAMAVVSGGTPPFSYLWSNGATTADISNLPAGVYTVTVTDAAFCTASASVTITESAAISVSINGTEIVCGAENDGEATAIVSGGIPPYTYQWSTGSNTPTIFDLPEGNYSVTVTDAEGCSATAEIDVDIIDDFELDIVIQNVLCFGEPTGSILAEGWGGTPPYTYQWNTGVTGTPLLENIPAGFYSVTVTDMNGCVLTESFNITEPPLLTAVASGSSLVCPGATTGVAMAMASGGTLPYSYLWSTGEVTQNISGLSAGTYTVTVTDANMCEDVATVVINEAPAVTVVITGTEIVCGAGNTGTATALATAGTPPFSYSWSNGQTGPTISNLPEGVYAVTVTDANGCTATDNISIDVIDDFEINGTPSNVLCFGGNTGRILVLPGGGTPPYTYLWSNGETTNEITGLVAGVYSITVTDANNCQVTETYIINQPPPINLSLSGTDITCFGFNNGTATSTVSGGTPPYSYLWSNGQTTSNIDNLSPGMYTLTVTDANLCTAQASITIDQPDEITINLTGVNLFCEGDNSGSISSMVSGGTMPYSYSWSTGANTPNIDNLAAGTYTLNVTDANGCTASASVNITQPDDLIVDLIDMDIFCDGVADGTITANPSGGTPPYSYEWNTGATTQTISNLGPGTYTVTVTDINECEVVGSSTIENFPGLMLTPIASSPNCFGEATGAAAVIVNAGTPPFTYLWDNGATTFEILDIPAGTYTVTVTDAVGCAGVETIGIADPQELTATVTDASTTDASCNGFADGSATMIVNGGTPPYMYLWSDGQTTVTATGLAAGTYTGIVTDANGCTDDVSVTIDEPTTLTVFISTITGGTCVGSSDGAVNAIPNGGTPPYSYSWSNGVTTALNENLAAGTYTVTVTDANNCVESISVTISSFPTPTCSINVIQESTMGNNGELGASVNGGTPPFTYLWSNGGTTPGIDNLAPGLYSLTVTDANGCQTTCSATLDALSGIGDYVWEDINHNGIQDANEPPVEGVMVILQIPGESNPTNIDTMFTDANGQYLFVGLPPGDYKLTFVLPMGFQFTDLNAGTDPGLDSDADPDMNGMTIVTTLDPGEIDLSWDAGIDLIPYNDIDDPCFCLNNATTDENGQFLETLTIFSYPNETWTIIDQEGMYDINSPPPPAPPIPVPDGIVIPESNTTPGAYPFTYLLVDAEPYTIFEVSNGFDTLMISNVCFYPNVNLEELPPLELCVSDDIYVPNANPSIPGDLTFYVNGIPVSVIDPSIYVTGTYEFIAEFIPSDPEECEVTIITSFTIVEDCLAKLGDYVWLDEDGDGIQDPNEDGVEDVMVILQDPGGTNLDTTFTDVNGNYCFFVTPGDYKVTFVLPDGFTFSPLNAGSDDNIDSDADPDMGGMTEVYTVMDQDTILTIDAGIDDKCDNITNPGTIGPNQFLCGPGNDPDPIVNVTSPTGGSGAIEYLWMSSTIPGPFNVQTWSTIPGATGPSYDPGPLSETTYFTRCVRRECCTVYLESNIVTIEVGSVAVADIQGPDFICVGEPTTFFAAGAGANAVINWTFGPGISPQTATGPSVPITINSQGIYTITLEVTENGCTSTDVQTITGTSSPIYCAGLMPIVVEVTDQVAGDVKVSWMLEEELEGYIFEVLYSEDAQNFDLIGAASTPRTFLGGMGYYEHFHFDTKRGHNYYQVRAIAPNGDSFLSEIEDAVIYGDSKIALLYPNPVTDIAVLELFETFGQDVVLEVVSANGARMYYQEVSQDTERVLLDCSAYPSGPYFIKVRYSRSGLKVLKLLKR